MQFGGNTHSRSFLLIALALVVAASAGCGSSVPSESLAQQVVAANFGDLGTIADFRKTNGRMNDFGGAKTYTITFRAAVKLNSGVCMRSGIAETEVSRNCQPRFMTRVTALSEGSLYIFRGYAGFQETERGWRMFDWGLLQREICNNGSATECYAESFGSEARD